MHRNTMINRFLLLEKNWGAILKVCFYRNFTLRGGECLPDHLITSLQHCLTKKSSSTNKSRRTSSKELSKNSFDRNKKFGG